MTVRTPNQRLLSNAIKASLTASILAAALASANNAAANEREFRIYDVQQEENQLFIYHDFPVEEGVINNTFSFHRSEAMALDDSVRCVIAPDTVGDNALRPNRGGDRVTTLIIMDRSHTRRWGGTTDIGVRNFIIDALPYSSGDTFAVYDVVSEKRGDKGLDPTAEADAIDAFFEDKNLGPAIDGDPEIFKRTVTALELLEKSENRLSTVILISDGMTTSKESAAQIDALIAAAKKKHISISAVHIDRSTGKGRAKQDTSAGRANLEKIQTETGGLFKQVQLAPFGYNAALGQALRELAVTYANMHKTTCTLCGDKAKNANKDVQVELLFKKNDKVVARSVKGFGDAFSRDAVEEPEACAALLSSAGSEGKDAPKEDSDGEKDNKTSLLVMILGVLLALIGVILAILSRFVGGQDHAGEDLYDPQSASPSSDQLYTPPSRSSSQEAGGKLEPAETVLDDRSGPSKTGTSDSHGRPATDTQKLLPKVTPTLSSVDGAIADITLPEEGLLYIGANSDNDVVLTQDKISGEHARLIVEGDTIYVEDLNSTNGTFLYERLSKGNESARWREVRLQPKVKIHILPSDEISFSKGVRFRLIGTKDSGKAQPRKTSLA